MRIPLAFALSFLLAACGQEPKAQHPAPVKTQNPVVQSAAPPFVPRQNDRRTFFHGPGSEPKMPSWLPLYSDAKIVSGFVRPSRFGPGGSVIFTSAAQPGDIIAFYERTGANAGFVETSNQSNGGTLSYSARAGQSHFQVIAEPVPGGSHIQLFWAGSQ